MMQAYFKPDISSLREVPKARAEQLLGLAETGPQEAGPDTLLVEQLLGMILLARQNAVAPAPC